MQNSINDLELLYVAASIRILSIILIRSMIESGSSCSLIILVFLAYMDEFEPYTVQMSEVGIC